MGWNHYYTKDMTYEHIHDQGSGKMNEDAWFANGNTFGVFDGASGLDKYTDSGGKTGGYFASHIAADIFENETGNLHERFRKANEMILNAMKKVDASTTDKANLWCTGVAVVEIMERTINWIQTSDCLIILVNKDGSYKQLIRNYDHDYETLMMGYELAQKKTENIRDKLLDQLKKVRRESNILYGVMNGEKEALDFVNQGSENLTEVQHILIFTDGLFIPKENPSKPDDFDTLVGLYLKKGIAGVKDYVRKLENSDPNLWRCPRFKKHDDIASIAITL